MTTICALPLKLKYLCACGAARTYDKLRAGRPHQVLTDFFFPFYNHIKIYINLLVSTIMPPPRSWTFRRPWLKFFATPRFSLIWYLKNEHLLPTILSLLSYPVLVFTKFLDGFLFDQFVGQVF